MQSHVHTSCAGPQIVEWEFHFVKNNGQEVYQTNHTDIFIPGASGSDCCTGGGDSSLQQITPHFTGNDTWTITGTLKIYPRGSGFGHFKPSGDPLQTVQLEPKSAKF